ncbi:DUF6498-containing protein [Halorussus litoreus]|uniref:DUF6498-containing protein n=1 Tax=Halorussus litoreus TaxID=1710536 RepID=UPI000E288C03|nr:DUF6498-containing protein [Halorussus litoreus]
MAPTDSTESDRLRSAGRCGLLIAGNLLPLVGVIVWNWDLAALLVLYGVEGVVTAATAALKMLFAERVPSARYAGSDLPFRELLDKRGGVRVVEGWPPIYPRNLPFALGMGATFLFVWGGIGALVVADFVAEASGTLLTTVLLSGVGLLVTRLAEFRTEYLGGGEYTDVSARSAATTPSRQMILVFCLLPLLAVLDESRAAGTVLLVVVVALKTLTDAYGFWVDHLDRPPLRVGEWLLGVDETGDPPPAVTAPDRPVDARVGTDTSAVLFTGLIPVALALVSRGGLLGVLGGVLAITLLGLPGLVVGGAVVTAVAGANLLVHYVRYGTLEYRRRGDTLVCYDEWLDEPQWTCEIDAIRDCSVERRITSKLFGTTVVTFEADDARFRVGPVSDADIAFDALGFPYVDASQDEPNRGVAVAAVGLAGLFLAIPAGLYLAPGVSTADAVGVAVVLVPTTATVVGPLLWVSLYNA